jgi:hypothetical protein
MANFPNVTGNFNGRYPSQSSSSRSNDGEFELFDSSFPFGQAKDPIERPKTPGPEGRQEKDTNQPSKNRPSSRRDSRSISKKYTPNVKAQPSLPPIQELLDPIMEEDSGSSSSSSKENNPIKATEAPVTTKELLDLR